jgi:membrane-associated phospholipid phosphatase
MSVSKNKLFGMPKAYDAWIGIVLTLFFILFFLLAYGGASYISGHIPWRFELPVIFEHLVPFVPLASIVYLSLMAMLMLSLFIMRRSEELILLFSVLIVETVIAAIFFILFPVETAFPERNAQGVVGAIFDFADFLNMQRNFFPSLHVCFALTAALYYAEKTQFLVRSIFFIWALAISISTVLIHEHYIVDVFAGWIFALVCWKIVGQWLNKGDVLTAINIELFCLYNFSQFGQRHPRYLLIALGLYKQSIPFFRRSRLLRTGFCFLQLVDDILDGDRECDEEPIDYVNKLVTTIMENEFEDSEVMQLAHAFRRDLYDKGGEEALNDALTLIHVMQQDRKRVLLGKILSREQLKKHHQKTFTLSVNLMLLAGDAKLRVAQVPELIDAFAWCTTVRDLKEDLAAGLVNIPEDVINNAREQGAKTLNFKQLIKTVAVLNWLHEERTLVQQILDVADRKLEKLHSVKGVGILQLFSRSIRDYAFRRFPKHYPDAVMFAKRRVL